MLLCYSYSVCCPTDAAATEPVKKDEETVPLLGKYTYTCTHVLHEWYVSGYVLYELPHQHVHVITPMVAKDD